MRATKRIEEDPGWTFLEESAVMVVKEFAAMVLEVSVAVEASVISSSTCSKKAQSRRANTI